MLKRVLLLSVMAMTMMLSACGAEKPDNLRDGGVTEAVTEEETTEKETEKPTEEETTKAQEKPTKEPETKKLSGKTDPIISSAITNDGFITYSRDDISKMLASAGMVEKRVSLSEVESGSTENGKQKIYHFAMQNKDSVTEIDSKKGHKLYITSLLLNGETYYVSFGTSEDHSYEEIEPYCAAGKQVEYWAYASSQDGMVILIPFLAGSEANGYYLILPCIEQMGGDVSDFRVPDSPIGDDIGSSNNTTTNTTEPETIMSDSMLEKIALDVTGVKNNSIVTTVNCNVTNGLDFRIALKGEQLFLNGVECSDKFTSFFIVDGNDVLSDAFYLDGIQLKAGDKLQFVYGLSNNDTFEDLGQIYFEMVLQ